MSVLHENIASGTPTTLDTLLALDVSDSDNEIQITIAQLLALYDALTKTLTNKTIDADNNTLSNLRHGDEVDEPSSGVHGVTGDIVGDDDTQTLTNKTIDCENNSVSNVGLAEMENAAKTQSIIVAASDEDTDLETGTAKVTFRMPYGFTLTGVRANVKTAPTGSVLTVDINENGTTILSTKITIDAGEKTSQTATNPPVISDASLADDAEITIDIDTIGSTVAGTGLKVALIGYKTA